MDRDSFPEKRMETRAKHSEGSVPTRLYFPTPTVILNFD